MVVVDIVEGDSIDFLRIRSQELEVGESARIPFRVDSKSIRVGYRFEKWDSSTGKLLKSDEPKKGYQKVFYRKLMLTEEDDRPVLYRFTPGLNDAFLARVAELLLDGKKVEDTTFVLYVHRYGKEKFHVRYSIFIENGGSGKKKVAKKKGFKKQTPEKIVKDVLMEFGYEYDDEDVQYIIESLEGNITRERVAEFLREQEEE